MSHITFRTSTCKNFLSYGNVETVFTYDTHKHTIITAKNGGGKSAIGLDVLLYGIFGKPYRDIKLGQLINTINNKQSVVTVLFDVDVVSYKVIRGQKPAIFEIYRDGVLIPEAAKSSDYQAMLEKIIGFNYKTFKQIVAIGSASYKPFLDLDAKERREVIEDVLDIGVFSAMSKNAKIELDQLKATKQSLSDEITLLKNNAIAVKRTLDAAQADQSVRNAEIQSQIDKEQESIGNLNIALEPLKTLLGALKSKPDTSDTIKQIKTSLESSNSVLAHQKRTSQKLIDFFSSNDKCPQCSQEISHDLKESVCRHEDEQITEIDRKISESQIQLDVAIKKLDIFDQINRKINATENEIRLIQTKIDSCNRLIKSLTDQLNQSSESVQIETVKQHLKSISSDVIAKMETLNQISDSMQYYDMCIMMLKDTGIKANIIKTYIPILNKLINEYLAMFDMFVLFELDENFNETVKSRHRDTFTFNSFSEGEKKKIDLSLLFAWRKITMSMNAVSTNILIFDETLDSSLDAESVDSFMGMLDMVTGEGVNSIVISHRGLAPSMFDRHIEITKVNDFSYLKAFDK